MSQAVLDGVRDRLADLGLSPDDAPGGAERLVWRLQSPTGDTHDYALTVVDTMTSTRAAVIPDPAQPTLVVAGHLSEPTAEVLRHRGFHFADTAGNAYLRWPDLHVDVRGRKAPRTSLPALDQPTRAFGPRGHRVTFALLCDPTAVDLGYRELAERSGASLGTVQAVLQELQVSGFIESSSGGSRRLHRSQVVLDRWVETFALRNAPKLLIGRFTTVAQDWWQDAERAMRDDHAVWGGETAVHLLDPYLRPETSTLYADDLPRAVIGRHRLRKAADAGTVVVRRRFWNWTEPQDGPPLAPTPLIYADLVATADPRCLEAAARLRSHDALLQELDRG